MQNVTCGDRCETWGPHNVVTEDAGVQGVWRWVSDPPVYGTLDSWRWTAQRSFETLETIHPTTHSLVPKERNPPRNIPHTVCPLGIYRSSLRSFLRNSGFPLRWHRTVSRRNTLPTSTGCKTESAPSSATSLPTYQTTRCPNLNNHNVHSPCLINPYPTAFLFGNGMVLNFYQQQESSTTKTVHKVINKRLKTYV